MSLQFLVPPTLLREGLLCLKKKKSQTNNILWELLVVLQILWSLLLWRTSNPHILQALVWSFNGTLGRHYWNQDLIGSYCALIILPVLALLMDCTAWAYHSLLMGLFPPVRSEIVCRTTSFSYCFFPHLYPSFQEKLLKREVRSI